MNIVAEIKSKLDIVEVAGESLELKRRGKNWMTRCPFHEDRNPSLVIFPDSQRWKCFGSGCNLGGDVFDLVQKLEKWDFGRTLRALAEKAGVAVSALSEEEQKRVEKRWEREEVFNAAMAYFQDHLLQQASQGGEANAMAQNAGLRYALGRGWTKETLMEAGIGSVGNEREGLRRFLKEAGINLELPAAVALLGRRGKVKEWAQQQGVEAAQKWLDEDLIPGMPGNMLIYPHMERGRVAYLAGRKMAEKGHWNPPRELAGPRQPYYNTLWWRENDSPALVVEGQGDALTLGQWGAAAVALAGRRISRRPTSVSPRSCSARSPSGTTIRAGSRP